MFHCLSYHGCHVVVLVLGEASSEYHILLFFGKETAGLPMDFRERFRERCIRLPMIDEARSLNLSNTVAVCVYEALRQNDFPGLLGVGEMAKTP